MGLGKPTKYSAVMKVSKSKSSPIILKWRKFGTTPNHGLDHQNKLSNLSMTDVIKMVILAEVCVQMQHSTNLRISDKYISLVWGNILLALIPSIMFGGNQMPHTAPTPCLQGSMVVAAVSSWDVFHWLRQGDRSGIRDNWLKYKVIFNGKLVQSARNLRQGWRFTS